MSPRQLIAVSALPVLCVTMYALFRGTSRLFGGTKWLGIRASWLSGLFVYWPTWGIVFPLCLLGPTGLRGLFAPQKPTPIGVIAFLVPIAITLLGRFFMRYEQVKAGGRAVLALTAFVTGTLEEVLWRGVFVSLFPGQYLWGFAWPSLWFGMWHLAPGSESAINRWALMGGALVYGACWGILAMQTRTLGLSILSHILTGLSRAL